MPFSKSVIHALTVVMKRPHFNFETQAMRDGALRVAGIDEVGRGPLAGPVMAAAVVLDPDNIPDGLNDSKTLSLKQRQALYKRIVETAEFSVASASVAEIDSINILQASLLAMKRAVDGLGTCPDIALIDGNRAPDNLPCPARPIVKGDTLSLSIAAASIVAKVRRDTLMWDLAQQYPGYGWETNAGYGSKSHIAALRNLGPTPHHRRSFKPLHNML